MRTHRDLRVAELIREELGKMLARDFDFLGALVTILDVEVTRDLLHAKVKLGIIPRERGPEVFFKLKKAERMIQGALLRKLNIRPMPHISFGIVEE